MKLHPILLVGVSCWVASCEKINNPLFDSAAEASYVAQYRPPVFSDTARIKRMKDVSPAIEKVYREFFEKNHYPGMAFGIVADGNLISSGAFGLAAIEGKTPVTLKTGFRIASMSKSFTAMAILRLRDEGKLNLHDAVAKYIPEVGKLQYLTRDSRPITIEQLLTMSAGFPEDNPWGDRQLEDSDEDLRALIDQGISFSNAPGLTFEYSNLGFAMLGRIVTATGGKPYQQYINENILRPLQMNDARWEFTEVDKRHLATGYEWGEGQWKEEHMLHDGAYGAMGGLICSVEDFSKYLAFHLSGWPPRNDQESPVLKRNSLREMHQLQRLGGFFAENKDRSGKLCPAISGYGYGLAYRRDCSGTVSIRHGGGLPGFGSEWRFYPEYGIGAVALGNLEYGGGGLGSVNSKALDTLIYLAGLGPRTLPPSTLLEQRQQELSGLLPSSWPNDKLSIFAENFFLDLSLESWKKSTAELFKEIGKIVKVNPVVPENQLRGSFLIEGEKKDLKVFFTLTPEKDPLIQQLDLAVQPKTPK